MIATASVVLAAVAEAEDGVTHGLNIWVWVALVIALLLIVANGFFVALEFALIATQRSQLEASLAENDPRAEKALASITELGLQVSGAQLGITLATIALGYLAEPSIAAIIEWMLPFLGSGLRHIVALIVATAIVVFLHMVVGEMVPKNIALADPAQASMRLAPLHRWFVRLTGPVIIVLNALSMWMVRLIGVQPVDERGEARTPAELASLIEESRGEGVLDEFEHSLLAGTLDLREATVASEMVGWASVDRVHAGATVAEIEQAVVTSGHSRLPVVDGTGNVSGWVHAKDLLHFDAAAWDQPYPLDLLHAPLRVTPNMNLEQVLLGMQRVRRHFALVVAEDGAMAGIITLEDVLESVVGEIVDETDIE